MSTDGEHEDEGGAGPDDLGEVDESLDALLTPEPPPPERRSRGSAPLKPSAHTEKTLGLELGRLFGVNPRLLVDPEAAARPSRRPDDTADPADTDATDDTVDTNDTDAGYTS